MYDPKRDIEKRFGNHRIFRVRAFEPKAAEPAPESGRNKDDDAMLQRLVSECGQVVNIDLKRKFVPAGPTRSVEICFAFIEFMRPDSVDEAASTLNGMTVDEHTIRVERKQSQFSERPRRNFTARTPIATRPHPHNRSQAQNWREPMDSRHPGSIIVVFCW
ncbi:hypothetical protein ESCO_001614 [Escovopsis weberi]|uniref:RRM domain-containing protein n=1 Tax=Escovopsis weberi TaxID=150374 RepID=A0A0N0RTZ6_ESCWE|nr:hypothetical protein ESCO_001614 [Escovopsis weberi]